MDKEETFQISRTVHRSTPCRKTGPSMLSTFMKTLRVSRIGPTYLIFLTLLGSCETKELQDSSRPTTPHNKLKADCDTQDKNINWVKDSPEKGVVDLSDEGNTGCSLENSPP